jgi:hypothetical protein
MRIVGIVGFFSRVKEKNFFQKKFEGSKSTTIFWDSSISVGISE